MNDQRAQQEFRRERRDIKPAGGRAHQHHTLQIPFRRQTRHGMRGHKSTKGKPSQHQRTLTGLGLNHGQQVIQFAPAFVVHASALPNAPEIEPHSSPTARHTSPSHGLYHFVGQGAAVQGMRMGNHGCAARCACRPVNGYFNGARRAILQQSFGLCVHRPTSAGVRRRSTTTPSRKWESTISSMSASSTKVYQTASG